MEPSTYKKIIIKPRMWSLISYVELSPESGEITVNSERTEDTVTIHKMKIWKVYGFCNNNNNEISQY